jgi:recombination protein RecA
MKDFGRLHGPGIIRRSTEMPMFYRIPTGILSLDLALAGGLPRSAVSQVYGRKSGGKTTLTFRMLAAAQRQFPSQQVVFVAAEDGWDPTWAAAQGLDLNRVVIIEPDTGEQGVDAIAAILAAGDVAMIAVDSLPGLVPLKAAERSAEDRGFADHANLMHTLSDKLNVGIRAERKRNHYPAIVLVNQVRDLVGAKFPGDRRPGGRQIEHVSQIILRIKNDEKLGRDALGTEYVDHNVHSFSIEKNKLGQGPRNGEWRLVRNPSHPRGPGWIDDGDAVIAYGRRFDLVTGSKAAGWRAAGIDQSFSGGIEEASKAMIQFLGDNPEQDRALRLAILSRQRSNVRLPPEGWL